MLNLFRFPVTILIYLFLRNVISRACFLTERIIQTSASYSLAVIQSFTLTLFVKKTIDKCNLYK